MIARSAPGLSRGTRTCLAILGFALAALSSASSQDAGEAAAKVPLSVFCFESLRLPMNTLSAPNLILSL
jgi:hypothetical protein